MKMFFKKGLGFLAIFALVFSTSGIARAQVNPNDSNNCEVPSQNYFSDDSDATLQVDAHNAVAVTPINTGWTASIPGAEWVWSEVNVTDATIDITKTFTKTFTITGTPTGGTLDIAADNSYEVSVNGNTDVFVDALENNYASGVTTVPCNGQDSYVIPAGYLQTGTNTITFEVKNMGIVDSNVLDNPAGLMYKININCTPNEVEPVCVEGNIVTNGGFEMPVVTNTAGWDVYNDDTAGLGWDVKWNGAFAGSPTTAKLELHRGVNAWGHDEAMQHAELDTDWGTNDGEQASVMISQSLATVSGEQYQLSYAFSPRPDTIAAENVLQVWVEGVLVQTQGPVAGGVNTSWNTYTYNFTATDNSTTLAFKDAGTPNSVGTLLDDVSVDCNPEPEENVCEDMLYARIKTAQRGGWNNWGTGNLGAWNTKGVTNPPVYVGGNNLLHNTSGGDGYTSEEWFPLVNEETCEQIIDEEFNFNVPGVAVQRMDNSIRVVLYGSHSDGGNPARLINREFARGTIQLSKDKITMLAGAWDKANGWVDPVNTYTRVHDPLVNDAANPMDARGNYNGGIHMHHPLFDNVKVLGNLFRFHLVVTTGNDGFYAKYNN